MNNATMTLIIYVAASSFILANAVFLNTVQVKNAACASAKNAEYFSGMCASDGNGFVIYALGIFIASIIFVVANLWIIKRLKI